MRESNFYDDNAIGLKREIPVNFFIRKSSLLKIQEDKRIREEWIQTKMVELSSDQQKTMAEMSITDERLADITDQASFQSDRNFELRIRDRERKLIAKMHEAIQMIDNGTYGICEHCDEEISEKRLIARPVTTFCLQCKTEQEKFENLKGKWGGQTMRFNPNESPLTQEDDFS